MAQFGTCQTTAGAGHDLAAEHSPRPESSPAGPQLLPAVHLGLGSYYDLTGDSRAALESYRRYLTESEPGDPQLPLVRQWVDVLERIYEGPR